jgi:hypothetical protein
MNKNATCKIKIEGRHYPPLDIIEMDFECLISSL